MRDSIIPTNQPQLPTRADARAIRGNKTEMMKAVAEAGVVVVVVVLATVTLAVLAIVAAIVVIVETVEAAVTEESAVAEIVATAAPVT